MSTFPAKRLDLAESAPKTYASVYRLTRSIGLDERLHALIQVRASQLNGCAFCIDMHWQDARAAAEPEARLYSLAAWRESPLYDTTERAALELCEAMTLIAGTGVPDSVWDHARTHFAPHELAQLVFAIAEINAWNRICIAVGTEPGHYRPARPRAA